jgi:hypothetical protein
MYKVYGERNSGTNFIQRLLEINFNIKISSCEWKHSIPISKNPNSIEFIIVRNLPSWLSSMYTNPYHLAKFNNFTDFLTLPQIVIEDKYKTVEGHDVHMIDNNKTIFDIRYSKYKGLIQYFNTYNNVCIVNLNYIQNDSNCLLFLKNVNSSYKLNKTTPYITTIPHTKNNSKYKNRLTKIKLTDYLSTINTNLNSKLEREIESLTFKIKE